MQGFRTAFGIVTLICISRGLDTKSHIADFTRSGSSAVSECTTSSGLMGLETPNDASPELTGEITNNGRTLAIRSVRFWVERNDGAKIPSSAASPLSRLETGPNVGGLVTATLTSSAGGVATFNLAESIDPGAVHVYEAEVDSFVEPKTYRFKMSFSALHTPIGSIEPKHYEILGDPSFTTSSEECSLAGSGPTTRTGVVFSAENAQSGRALRRLAITLSSQSTTLKFKGGEAEDANLKPIAGVSSALSNDDKTITFSGLDISTAAHAVLWLNLNSAYEADTTFRVEAVY